jgi:membrane protease YdiL (CAAX protease family)
MSRDNSSAPIQVSQSQSAARPAVNWRQVGWFLGLTFFLTWLLDLVLFLKGGLKNPSAGLLLQFQMMLPAFSALLLGVFFFKDSPVHLRSNRTTSRWFVWYFFLLTILYLAGTIAALLQPGQTAKISQWLLLCNLPGLILLIVLRLVGGKNAFTGAGMGGGRWLTWLLLGLALVAFYGLETLLNYLFKLGKLVDIASLYPAGATAGMPPIVLLLTTALNAVVIGPFLGLIITFGEEYGWRGFLQSQLTRLGKVKGVLLLGVIWGVWHWPIIWMGYNYPGQPLLGSILMVAFCIVLAFFLAHAVFKSKGVWTAAYLHALSNQTMSFFMVAVVTPLSMVFSFGIGIPGLVLCALVVLILLRDPVWKETDSVTVPPAS